MHSPRPALPPGPCLHLTGFVPTFQKKPRTAGKAGEWSEATIKAQIKSKTVRRWKEKHHWLLCLNCDDDSKAADLRSRSLKCTICLGHVDESGSAIVNAFTKDEGQRNIQLKNVQGHEKTAAHKAAAEAAGLMPNGLPKTEQQARVPFSW